MAFSAGCRQAQSAPAAEPQLPRTADGKPDFSGIWQAFTTAGWDLEDHSAEQGVPAGQTIIDGGEIPYQPWALAKKKENYANRSTLDPLSKCYMPGVPRAMYLPFPFEIVQTPQYMGIFFEYGLVTRMVFMDGSKKPEALEFWMGDSRGRWEGDTLVVDVTLFTDKTWFDKADDTPNACSERRIRHDGRDCLAGSRFHAGTRTSAVANRGRCCQQAMESSTYARRPA